MDIESLITILVTLFLGVVGFMVNTFIQRKNNSIKIITQYRIDRKNATQEITAKLLAYTDYNYHQSLTYEEKQKNIQKIVIAISNLRSIYYFSFPKDVELVEAAYKIKKLYCQDKQNWREINNARAEYAHLADVYTSTDWKRIKLETIGKGARAKNALPSWTEIFNGNDAHFSSEANIDIFIDSGSESDK